MFLQNASFWVISDGGAILRILFDSQSATATQAPFVTVFDGNGGWLKSYKLVDGDYTDSF